MFQYNFVNNPNFLIDENIIKDIFFHINKEIIKDQFWTLNIIFVWDNEIKNLNKTYRQKDYITDVLSFHYYDDFSKLKKEDIAWELIFCENKIKTQWIEYKLWEQKEFYKLLIHSILHILWYDHEIDSDYELMQKEENTIWNKIFEKK